MLIITIRVHRAPVDSAEQSVEQRIAKFLLARRGESLPVKFYVTLSPVISQ